MDGLEILKALDVSPDAVAVLEAMATEHGESLEEQIRYAIETFVMDYE